MIELRNYLIIVLSLLLVNLNAQTLDVDFTCNTCNCSGSIGLNENQTLAQSFTAGISGDLSSVKVGLSTDACTETNVMNCVAKIYEGQCNGTLLTTENFSIPTGESISMYQINFSTPAKISSGQLYTLELSVLAGQACTSDPYMGNRPVYGSWYIYVTSNCGSDFAGGTAYEPNCSAYPGDFYLQTLVNNQASGTDTRTECDSYVWIDGNIYTSSNNTATYNIVGGAANGGDSLVTLDLTIINSAAGTDTRTECNSYTWVDGNSYTSSNNTATYKIIGGAANGCDSLVTLDLTIKSVSNLTATLNGVVITASNNSAEYRWLDCDKNYSIISGETEQSFIPAMNSNYAAELTENGCVDTSSCVSIISVGLIENTFGGELLIYPNPTVGNFSVDLGKIYESAEISISEINGKLIRSLSVCQEQILSMSINEPMGFYLITVTADGKLAVFRLLKQ
jgi:hypothetical protein